MTASDLLRLCREVRRGCNKWFARAKASDLPAVLYQRAGLRGIGGTRLGVLWTPERVDDAFKYIGTENRHRLLYEANDLARWIDWTGQTESEGIEWADELADVRESWAYDDFEAIRTGGTAYDLYQMWDDPDAETFQSLAEAFTRIRRKSEPLTEIHRSPDFPTSGTTYRLEIVASGPFWSVDFAGFESLKLDRLTGVFPVIWKHEWSLPEPPEAAVPVCVSQWAKVPFKCCL